VKGMRGERKRIVKKKVSMEDQEEIEDELEEERNGIRIKENQ
jgi:hypothetical protein